MKKILLPLIAILISMHMFAQSGAEFIYVNPTESSQGVMYKSPDGSGTYVVLPKNTLYSISKLHGMSVDELQSLNNLFDTKILIGQRLKVKATATAGKGLNLGGEAQGTAIASNLETSHLAIKDNGDLEISASHPAMLRAEKLKSENVDLEASKGTHLNRDGEWWYVANDEDNFHKIAVLYDMSFDSLKTMNEMNDYLFRKGMVLIVKPGKLYGVKMMPEKMPEVLESSDSITVEKVTDPVVTNDNVVNDTAKSEVIEAVEEVIETTEEVIQPTEEIMETVEEVVEEETAIEE